MSKFLRWGTVVVALVLVLGLVVRSHYVLDSRKLDTAIKSELPPGTLKARVIDFIRQRKPQFCDDPGTHVKARITGRAGVGSGNSEPPIPEILSRFVFSGKVSSRLR